MCRLLVLCLVLVTACRPAADPHLEQDELDPMTFAIETGRWQVMIDNARSALELTERDVNANSPANSNAHFVLKRGALELAALRDDVCRAGLMDEATCAAFVLPAWVYVYEPTPPPLMELKRRSDWLGAALQPYEAAACADIRTREGIPNRCSVE